MISTGVIFEEIYTSDTMVQLIARKKMSFKLIGIFLILLFIMIIFIFTFLKVFIHLINYLYSS